MDEVDTVELGKTAGVIDLALARFSFFLSFFLSLFLSLSACPSAFIPFGEESFAAFCLLPLPLPLPLYLDKRGFLNKEKERM